MPDTQTSNTQTPNSQTPDTPKSGKPNVPVDRCPACSRELVGAIEITEGGIGGLKIVVMRETADRNWIACDACNRTICKSCCALPDSGYCDSCFVKYKIEPYLPAI